MDVLEECKDANKLILTGTNSTYVTNTYYPPGNFLQINISLFSLFLGTVCARNTYLQSCFYSGESGSPLLARLFFLALTGAQGVTPRPSVCLSGTKLSRAFNLNPSGSDSS